MTLSDPPLPLAQSMEFKVGDTFTVNPSVDEDDACFDSDSVSIEVREFDATPAGGLMWMSLLLCQLVLL